MTNINSPEQVSTFGESCLHIVKTILYKCTHNMFLNFRIHSIIIFFFYLVLIGVATLSWMNLMEERTTFEETIVENGARLPSITLCPDSNEYSDKSIESFEDIEEDITNSKKQFKITYYHYKPNGEIKSLNDIFNQTLNNDWYFAPTIRVNKTLTCLIMSPFKDQKVLTGGGFGVSYCYNSNIFLELINYILVSLITIPV